MTNFLSHGTGATAKVVFKQLSNEALKYQNLSDGGVGGQSTQESNAVTRDCRCTAIALGGRCVTATKHREGPVLTGSKSGLGAAA